MFLDKNRFKYLLSIIFKTGCLIIGLDIFLTSSFTIIKEEFKNNNLESEKNLNIKHIKSNKNVQFVGNIY
tara:strand:- start:47 stop:256 length:210 start_codon:yes stop_codon:yes gene_type:complete